MGSAGEAGALRAGAGQECLLAETSCPGRRRLSCLVTCQPQARLEALQVPAAPGLAVLLQEASLPMCRTNGLACPGDVDGLAVGGQISDG